MLTKHEAGWSAAQQTFPHQKSNIFIVNNSGIIVRRLSLKSGARREVNMEKRTKQLMPKQNEGVVRCSTNPPFRSAIAWENCLTQRMSQFDWKEYQAFVSYAYC